MQKSNNFTHLHLHTSYSLLDGAIRIQDLMSHVKALGMSSVAMTDHGNMFGAIEFYKAACAQGIKPIIGCEFYISPGGRKEKKNIENLADGNNYHLILLAQNKKGYQNLIHLTSRSYTEGFYRKPRIDYELLEEHSEGLICLTACLGGEVQQHILKNRERKAFELAGRLREIFSRDRFYLEIQKHGLPEEERVAAAHVKLAKQLDIELCLTNDSHFLTKEDRFAQDILLRIHQKKTIDDPLFFSFNSEFYVKSPEEMRSLFPELPQAFHNTTKIADMVDLNFEFGNPLLPRFEVPEGKNLDTYLYELGIAGLRRCYKELRPEVLERFQLEYHTICKMDFSGYFLIVQDFIQFAKKQGIPTGPGRGSAAGSIIAYALGITDIDPLRYGLLFERFLNIDRKEMPDIDIDFCTERREEVIAYVRQKYGTDKVGQIVTYGTMAAKACLKDVARVLNIPFDEANKISRMFPEKLNISIDEAMSASSELRQYAFKSDLQKKLFTVAKTLEGNVRHTGVHAAGIVIAPEPLEQLLPMATVSQAKGSAKDRKRILVSQYDMQSLADVGLVKMDFLGLRNLTVIQGTVDLVRHELVRKGEDGLDAKLQDLEDLVRLDTELDDPKTYKLLQSGELAGVFQLETSRGMREFVMRLQPTCFEDIIALIALFRPGPLETGMANSYVNRKSGKEKLNFPHKDIQEILSETYGVILYQEQVMEISKRIGGFTPTQADSLRKAMGKKIPETMAQMQEHFVEGAVKKGYTKRFATDMYEQIAKFAGYGFNKSHSAAYACIVYQTAYLKANYPTEYMCALLNSELEKVDGLVPYIRASQSMGISILGPDINKSELSFSVERQAQETSQSSSKKQDASATSLQAPQAIRFGLAGIKNVGFLAAESLIAARSRVTSFHSFFHFMESIDLHVCNKRTVEALGLVGAFNNLGYARKTIQASVNLGFTHSAQLQQDKQSGQSSLFDSMDSSSESSSGSVSASLVEPIAKGTEGLEFSSEELLRIERDMLGFYLSGHPMKNYERALRRVKVQPLDQLASISQDHEIEVAGVIFDYEIRLTRAGKEMAYIVIEDSRDRCECILFPASVQKYRSLLVKGDLVLMRAVLEKGEYTGAPKLVIRKIERLDLDLVQEKQEKSLHIHLRMLPQFSRPQAGSARDEDRDNSVIPRLKSILIKSRGDLKVYFHLFDSQSQAKHQVIRAHDSFRVAYTKNLCQNLAALPEVYSIDLSIGDRIVNQHHKEAM